MKNSVKAILVATTALVGATNASANTIAEVVDQLELFGVDSSAIDFSTLESKITVDSTYSDMLIAEDAYNEADFNADFDDWFTKFDAYTDAVDAYSGTEATLASDIDDVMEGILEQAIDTRSATLISQAENFATDVGSATSNSAARLIAGIVGSDDTEKKYGQMGLNMVYTVIGKDIKYSGVGLQSAYTSNNKAGVSGTSWALVSLAHDAKDDLGVDTVTADDLDGSVELDALTIASFGDDLSYVLNGDGDAYVAQLADNDADTDGTQLSVFANADYSVANQISIIDLNGKDSDNNSFFNMANVVVGADETGQTRFYDVVDGNGDW